MSRKYLVLTFCCLVLLTACRKNSSTEPANLPAGITLAPNETVNSDGSISEERTESMAVPETYTMNQVQIHNTPDDCWMVIEGNVYDVTQFIATQQHPGGDAILQGCGKDATEMFNARPNGSGSHRQAARDNLPSYLMGVIQQ